MSNTSGVETMKGKEQESVRRQPSFGIQAAARRTGLSPHTLRLWEQRYGAVNIERSAGGRREYTEADLARLTLLRRLTLAGDRISRIAGLSDAQLENRLAEAGSMETDLAAGPAGILAVCGDDLASRLAGLGIRAGLTCPRLADFIAACRQARPALAMLEISVVDPDSLASLARLRTAIGPTPLAVIYGFGRHVDVESLRNLASTVRRAPADLPDLLRHLEALRLPRAPTDAVAVPQHTETGAPPAERRFTRSQLEQLASRSSVVACECPAQLVQLVRSLLAFEAYSATCAQQSPEDAALHAMLFRTTAGARRQMEDALAAVAQAEGIDL